MVERYDVDSDAQTVADIVREGLENATPLGEETDFVGKVNKDLVTGGIHYAFVPTDEAPDDISDIEPAETPEERVRQAAEKIAQTVVAADDQEKTALVRAAAEKLPHGIGRLLALHETSRVIPDFDEDALPGMVGKHTQLTRAEIIRSVQARYRR